MFSVSTFSRELYHAQHTTNVVLGAHLKGFIFILSSVSAPNIVLVLFINDTVNLSFAEELTS